MEKVVKFNHSIYVTGIWGRNRTAKTESFDVVETDNILPDDTFKFEIKRKIAEIKLKTPFRVTAHTYPVEYIGGMKSIKLSDIWNGKRFTMTGEALS